MKKTLAVMLALILALAALSGIAMAEDKAPAREYKTLEVGSKGDDVKELQQALIDGGFLSGKADGVYGKGTAGGVKAYQESVGLAATGVADEETQRKLYDDELPPVEIHFGGVPETDRITVNGLFVDSSYAFKDEDDMALLYLFYTAKTPDDSYKIDSKHTKLTFAQGGTHESEPVTGPSCIYMGSYHYAAFLTNVNYGEGAKVVETFKVPKAALVPGNAITLANSQIGDISDITLSTDDIITLAGQQAIAKVVDPEGYAERSYALSEADKDTKNKVLKAVNGYYWTFTVNNVSYKVDFGKYKFTQTVSIAGNKVNSKGTYEICNGFLILDNGLTKIYLPYEWGANDIDLKIVRGYDPDYRLM